MYFIPLTRSNYLTGVFRLVRSTTPSLCDIVILLCSILNRITPEKFSVLFEQLWAELQNDQVDVMGIVEQVIHTVFDIALDQPKFSFLYADVCYHLCRKIQTLKEQEPEEGSKEGEDGAKQCMFCGHAFVGEVSTVRRSCKVRDSLQVVRVTCRALYTLSWKCVVFGKVKFTSTKR